MNVGVLLLAAGRSSRFKSDKRRARLPDGRTVLDAALDNITGSALPCLVCLGEQDCDLADQLQSRNIEVRLCRRAQEGMGGTLAEGISALPPWDAVLVALADMPWIAPDTFLRVAAQLDNHRICIPAYRGQRGHPVGFRRELFPALSSLQGDNGARTIVALDSRTEPDCVCVLDVKDPGIRQDVDTPQDIRPDPPA